MSEDDAITAALLERARTLAEPREDARQRALRGRYLLVERGGVRYALDPDFAFGIARVFVPTPLPSTAPYWLGISSLYGELLAVFDLALLLSQEAAPSSPRSSAERELEGETLLVLTVGRERAEFGLAIDAVSDDEEFAHEVTRAPSESALTNQLVCGVTSSGTHVLGAEALLSDPRLCLPAIGEVERS